MFGGGLQLGQNSTFSANTTSPVVGKDFEVTAPPEDSISSLEFSPATLQQNFLISGSWDFSVRVIFHSKLNILFIN